MRDLKHLPIALAAAAVMLTQVLCAWWTTRSIEHNAPEYYGDVLERIEDAAESIASSSDKIESHTKSLSDEVSAEITRRSRNEFIDRLSR